MQMIPDIYWAPTFAVGLWMIAIGYYFLSFTYILSNRYVLKEKEDRRIYWLSFSLFFIFAGMGRAFYVIGDFFSVAWSQPYWRNFGSGLNWLAIGCLAIMSATMLLDNEKISNYMAYLLVLPPFIIGVIYPLIHPSFLDGTALYYILNFGVLIVYVVLITWLFGYLAILIPGEIRKKTIWTMVGFLLWFVGRTVNTSFFQDRIALIIPGVNGLALLSTISSGIVLLSLLAFSYSTRE